MLRFFTALVLALTLSGPAHAAPSNGFYGTSEKLVFASPTAFESDAGLRGLCTLVQDWHVLFVPVHREVKGYVLSDAACNGPRFSNVAPSAMKLLLSSGMIIDPVPLTPTLSIGWMLWNYASLIFIGLVILAVVLSKTRPKPVGEIAIPQTTKQTPMFDETLLTTMFHTARLNGEISQITLQKLIKSYKVLTGTTVTPAMITAKYALKTDTLDLLSIMPQFVGLERDTMMKACLDVASADGEIAKPEHDFLMALGSALDLDSDMFRNQIRAAMRPAGKARNDATLAPA